MQGKTKGISIMRNDRCWRSWLTCRPYVGLRKIIKIGGTEKPHPVDYIKSLRSDCNSAAGLFLWRQA